MKDTLKNRTSMLLFAILILLCTVIAAQLLAQEHEKPSAKGWEHCAITNTIGETPASELARGINDLGRKGWELVSVANIADSGTTAKTVFYFKRPL